MSSEELTKHMDCILNQGEEDYTSFRFLLHELEGQRLERSQVGPVAGLVVGYAHNSLGIRWRVIEFVLRFVVWWSWRHRPGYNDYLMTYWMTCKYEVRIVRRILKRIKHKDPMIAKTAKWMVDSVCQDDEKFNRIVHDIWSEKRK